VANGYQRAFALELAALGLVSKGERAARCGIDSIPMKCPDCGNPRTYVVEYSCSARFCSICGGQRAGELREEHLDQMQRAAAVVRDNLRRRRLPAMTAVLHLSVAVAEGQPERLAHERLQAKIRALELEVEHQFGVARDGYILAIHTEPDPTGQRVAVRILYEGPRLTPDWLRTTWAKLTGDGGRGHAFLRETNLEAALEVVLAALDDCLKATPERRAALEAEFHGVHLFRLHGVDAADDNAGGDGGGCGDGGGDDHDHDHGHGKPRGCRCPICGSHLVQAGPPQPRDVLLKMGAEPLWLGPREREKG